MTDLNTLIPENSGWTLLEANGINNNGQIVADGKGADGYTHALLLTPSKNYNFSGFFPPVDNEPTLNTVNGKTGKVAIQMKFSLGGDQGFDIFEVGYPSSTDISCPNQTKADAIEQTVATTATADEGTLKYDSATDQYTYTWNTKEDWKGTCRELNIKLDDGSEHKALFKFVR